MLVMLGKFVLNLRVFVMICAAIMCSNTAKVRSTMTPGYIRLKLNVLRPLNDPNSQQTSRSVGLPSKESIVQTETDKGGSIRETMSFINHQSPPQYTQSGFGFRQNDRNRRSRVKITKVQSRGVTPASGTFTRSPLYHQNTFDGWLSKKHDHAPPQNEKNINLNYFSQTWDSRYTKKSDNDENLFTTDSLKVDKDKLLGKSSPFPSQTNRLQSSQPLTSRGHYSDYKETNQLPVVRADSGLSGRSNALVFRSNTASHEASISNRILGQEKQMPVTNFSQNQLSVDSREMLGHRKILSYLFKDSPVRSNEVMDDEQGGVRMDAVQHKQNPFDAQEKNRFGLDFKRLATIQPVKQDTGGQKMFSRRQIRIYPPQHTTTPPPLAYIQPFSVEGKNLESFVPTIPLHSQDSYTTSSKTLVPVDRVNSTSREPKHDYKPWSSIKRISRLRGFTNSVKPPDPSPSKKPHFQQSSLDKGIKLPFRFTNMYSYLSPKYSFEQKGASAPAKPERTDSSSPALSIQVPSVSTPRPLTTTLRPIRRPLLKRVADLNKSTTEKQFKLYKGRFGLKEFGTQPLEGAKVLPQEPSTSTKTGFNGFQLKSLQTLDPKRVRIHRQYNQARDVEPGSRNITPVSLNERVRDKLKPVPRTPEDDGSVLKPTPDDQTNMVQTLQLLLRPVANTTARVQSKTNWTRAVENTVRASNVVSSSFLRSAGRLKTAPRPELKLSEVNLNKPVSTANQTTVFQTPTSSTVRGIRAKQASSRKLNGYTTVNTTQNIATIRGLRINTITYTDIVGSASFSSIKASSQPPVTLTDKDYFPNTTTTEQKPEWTLKSNHGVNSTLSREVDHETDQEDFISVETAMFGKDEDANVETSDLFFDSEGSAFGDLDLSEVSSTESQAAGKNLLELDYLQKSTGNVFFKSVTRSHLDQQ